MEDIEDVKNLTQLINSYKSTCQTNFQLEFENFITFDQQNNNEEVINEEIECNPENVELNSSPSINSSPDLPYLSQINFTIDCLQDNERELINNCNQSNLRQLMLLNRIKRIKLIQIHKKIKDLVVACKSSILMNDNLFIQNDKNKIQNLPPPKWKLSAPYFKDKQFFPCPHNSDVNKKIECKELFVFDLTQPTKWTAKECKLLSKAVKNDYKSMKIKEIKMNIKSLKDNKQKLRKLEKELVELENDKKSEVIPPMDVKIDWYKIVEDVLKNKHSVTECKAFWQIYLHPTINKSDWNENENEKIKRLAIKYSYQNWDLIAEKLGTNRTGFTTCLHYHSTIRLNTKHNFSKEEDKLLLHAVEYHRTGKYIPWTKISYYFDHRSRHQIYHRYTYYLSQANITRGRFNEAEDILLMILVNKFGKNFRLCNEYMPHRSLIQLKGRYNNNLLTELKKGTFTLDDDKLILDHVKNYGSKNWSVISKKLLRGKAQIRQRYFIIKNYLDSDPNFKLIDLPKRKHQYETNFDFLKFMAEQYVNLDFIPTVQMIEECLINRKDKLSLFNQDQEIESIDSILVNFLKTNNSQTRTLSNLNNFKDDFIGVLGLLNVTDLELPENYDSETDKELLEFICNNKNKIVGNNRNKLIAPNLSTLKGLNNLMLTINGDCSSNLNCQNSEVFEMLNDNNVSELELFEKRFNILFKWTGLLALDKPEIQLPKTSEVVETRSNKRKLTVSCDKNLNDNGPVQKKRLVNINENTQIHSNNLVEEPQLGDDLNDVKQLDLLLKSEGNSNKTINVYENEIETVEHDVELLNEILLYDKKNFL